MASQSASHYIRLAKALPPRLQQFLARYPPAAILPAASATATAAATAQDRPQPGAEPVPQAQPTTRFPTGYQQDTPNPFKPTKHPATGKWHDPIYSMRRQAELVKMAREYGVADLMPVSSKSPEERLRKRVAMGLRVKGTGVGQKVKGHKFERDLISKMEERRKAMLDMPNLIREWKKVGRRNWTRFPS